MKLRVKVKEPVLYNDESFVLDVSHDAFKKNPNKEYLVPDKPFWRERATGDRAVLILIGQEDDEKPKSKPKAKEEVKSDEAS